MARVKGQHVPVGVKDKAGKFREPWLTSDVKALVKKKEVHIIFRKSGSSKLL